MDSFSPFCRFSEIQKLEHHLPKSENLKNPQLIENSKIRMTYLARFKPIGWKKLFTILISLH
jgi:hypothetical protein